MKTLESGDGQHPSEALAEAMRRVARGNFDTKLGETDDPEFKGVFSDFNNMTEALLNTEQLRESFVSNVAHEFKTPLAYIQGYATMLQDETLSPAEFDAYVGRIVSAVSQLSTRVGNLLEISDLSRPTSTLETEPFLLDEQLRHVVALFVMPMERKGVRFDVDLPEIQIEGNQSLLEDAWTNLMSNAVKYTEPGGCITVTLERHYQTVVVAFSDTGCGMSEQQVQHAFDRFYQGDSTRKADGNGLGLPIVRAIVKKHGGTVNVKSEPGSGSTFTAILPMRQKAD